MNKRVILYLILFFIFGCKKHPTQIEEYAVAILTHDHSKINSIQESLKKTNPVIYDTLRTFNKKELEFNYIKDLELKNITVDFPKGVFTPVLHLEIINTGVETVEAIAISINKTTTCTISRTIAPNETIKTTIRFDPGIEVVKEQIKLISVILQEI